MSLHQKYQLKQVINAWGTPTLYGVSKSPKAVIDACAEALGNLYHMPELERVAGERIARFAGVGWGCVTHCTAAGITLACAAAMTGKDRSLIKRLPDTKGMRRRILIQHGHLVNYGHEMSQAIRLSGAELVIVGDETGTNCEQMEAAFKAGEVAAVVFVSSHLVLARGGGEGVPLDKVVELAHKIEVPVIVDGAAQDLRIDSLRSSGADLILISAQKYLRAPTAGLVLGRRDLVEAVGMQHGGIGRAMKPTKEAIMGVLAALEVREAEGLDQWAALRAQRVNWLMDELSRLENLDVALVPDPMGCPFQRIRITPLNILDANALAKRLAACNPVVATGAHYAHLGYLYLEAHELDCDEARGLVAALRACLKP